MKISSDARNAHHSYFHMLVREPYIFIYQSMLALYWLHGKLRQENKGFLGWAFLSNTGRLSFGSFKYGHYHLRALLS